MKSVKVVADICFPDLAHEQTIAAYELFQYYHSIDGAAGQRIVELGVEGDDFIIKLGLGIDCITLSKAVIERLFKEQKTTKQLEELQFDYCCDIQEGAKLSDKGEERFRKVNQELAKKYEEEQKKET